MDDLTPVLSKLPEPAPPDTLTATVMARIAREAECRGGAGAGAAVPARRGTERPGWLWSVAGVALVLGVSVYGWLSTGAMPDVTSSRIGPGRPSLPLLGGPFSTIMGLGLLIYLAGLFSPLRRR